MPNPTKRPHDAVERCAREEAEGKERHEEKRRERTEKISLSLRGMLIIWDIVSVLLH